MISAVAVRGYRSLRDVVLGLSPLTVVTGANGTGKSSVYRALRLLADCGRGEVIGSLAREGGLQSALWAGRSTRAQTVSIELGYAADDFGYLVDLGHPADGWRQHGVRPRPGDQTGSGVRRTGATARYDAGASHPSIGRGAAPNPVPALTN